MSASGTSRKASTIGKARTNASAVVLGRRTYEGLAAYWSPLQGDWANLINANAPIY